MTFFRGFAGWKQIRGGTAFFIVAPRSIHPYTSPALHLATDAVPSRSEVAFKCGDVNVFKKPEAEAVVNLKEGANHGFREFFLTNSSSINKE